MASIQFTDRGTAIRVSPRGRALARAAAAAASAAPCLLDTQPWRWKITGDSAELRADRGREAVALDPDGRLLMLSCGLALHHARIALAAEGVAVDVAILPDAADADLLATITCRGFTVPTTPATQRLRRAMAIRQTDRRPFADRPVPDDAARRLRVAAEAAGAHLFFLSPRDIVTLKVAADRFARYAVVFTDGDLRRDWIAAGEAVSAVLLTATVEGLATSLTSDLVDVPSSRALLRDLLCGVGYPAVAVRVGLHAGPAAPPSGRPDDAEGG